MNVVELMLPTINKLSSAYLTQKENILPFFTYNPFAQDAYSERKRRLEDRSFRREELASHLIEFNQRYNADSCTLHNIENLKKEESLVVIGGQQAGLLTGPIYTISKIISIIKLAEEQTSKLGVPVIPVFWIAGEDHDFQEINHINCPEGNEIEKHVFRMKEAGKKMVSDLEYDKEYMNSWMLEGINALGETSFTTDLRDALERIIHSSTTFVDVFANMVSHLFNGTGLVLVNASDPSLRKLEAPFLQRIIANHEQISTGILRTQSELQEMEFSTMLDVDKESMNLFYHLHGERELLYWDENKQVAFIKDTNREFTLDQLKQQVKEEPWNFSNNVVTRPLMQEYLFPTLAFIGGPGEISYWAELGRCFHSVELEMPPVVPRISLTLLERQIESMVEELEEPIQQVLENGLEEKRKAWLYKQELESLEKTLSTFEEQYKDVHGKFREVGNEALPHLKPAFEKNWLLIDKQFSYIHRLMERSAYEKHEIIMKKYERVELALLPKGMPQERVWNICYFLNKYGLDFVQRLCELPLEHNGKHKLIRL